MTGQLKLAVALRARHRWRPMLKVSAAATPPRIDHPLIRAIQRRSVAQMGLLLSAFLWAYAFAQLPIGALLDRIGPKRALGAGLLLWSAAQAAGGLMTVSYTHLRAHETG